MIKTRLGFNFSLDHKTKSARVKKTTAQVFLILYIILKITNLLLSWSSLVVLLFFYKDAIFQRFFSANNKVYRKYEKYSQNENKQLIKTKYKAI